MTGNPSASNYSSSSVGAGTGTGPGSSGTGKSGGSGCDFAFETVLASPAAEQVVQLRLGDTFRVTVQEAPPAVIVVTGAGDVVGGITQAATELRDCLQQGFEYTAEVVDIDGGAIRVFIQRADH